jgi:hypothetical protein
VSDSPTTSSSAHRLAAAHFRRQVERAPVIAPGLSRSRVPELSNVPKLSSSFRPVDSLGPGRHQTSTRICCAKRNFSSCFIFGEAVRKYALLVARKGRHAGASNIPQLCGSDGWRHHPSKYRVCARISGNVGTTSGLHAGRLAAVWRASPRCGQDRGLLTAKHGATQQTVPRGFRARR